MPNRPEKKELQVLSQGRPKTFKSYELGYNKGHDDLNEYLPSENEIKTIFWDHIDIDANTGEIMGAEGAIKALHERISK